MTMKLLFFVLTCILFAECTFKEGHCSVETSEVIERFFDAGAYYANNVIFDSLDYKNANGFHAQVSKTTFDNLQSMVGSIYLIAEKSSNHFFDPLVVHFVLYEEGGNYYAKRFAYSNSWKSVETLDWTDKRHGFFCGGCVDKELKICLGSQNDSIGYKLLFCMDEKLLFMKVNSDCIDTELHKFPIGCSSSSVRETLDFIDSLVVPDYSGIILNQRSL